MKDKYIEWAKEIIESEKQGLESVQKHIDNQFSKAIDVIMNSKGRVVLSGMGKSGLIARKISATMSSTGTTSLFMHPAEAYHGDLGMIQIDDVVILISNSGETEEVIKLIPFLKDNQNKIIAITNNNQSTIAQNATVKLTIGITEEVCPLNLAPTTSTTATLALGDALAIVLMRAKGFKRENFARLHPGGSLGRKLLTYIKDIMHSENLPIIGMDSNFTSVISKISHSKLGCAFVTDGQNKLMGIITDGDIRRAITLFENNVLTKSASKMMTASPVTITTDKKTIEAEKLMTEKKITVLPVVESEKLIGAIQLYDI